MGEVFALYELKRTGSGSGLPEIKSNFMEYMQYQNQLLDTKGMQ